MNLEQIKQAVESGKTVYWHHDGYKVIKDDAGQWLIAHEGGSCIGLTWKDGYTLNGKESDFHTE